MDPVFQTNILSRSFEIARVSAVYFLFYKFNRHKNKSLGMRIRLACEELGLVFIKLGQILSTRYDLLERKDCEELQKLLDEVPSISYETVEKIFISDFGKPPEQIFKEFDKQPIAAASIAQVYKAVLDNGEIVAVKVRRPGIDRAIRSDVRIFVNIAKAAEWFSPSLRHVNVPKILEQLEDWLYAEIDFVNEIKNLEVVNSYYHNKRTENQYREFAQSLVFPLPFIPLCSTNIITMTFIEGISMRQFKSVQNDPQYDIKASLEALMRAVLRAWINEDELYFHGDLHPSNLILLPGGRIGLLDFGLTGHFNEQEAQETRDLFLAVYSKNVGFSTELALKMCKAPSWLDTPELREDIRRYIEETRFSGLGFWFMGFMHIFVKHRIPMPYQLVLFGRCMATLEGLFETVLPGTSALDILGEELETGIRRRVFKNITSTNFVPILYALSEKIKQSPETVVGLIDKYFDNPLEAVRDIRRAVTGEDEWNIRHEETYYSK